MNETIEKPRNSVAIYFMAALALALGVSAGVWLQKGDSSGGVASGLPVYDSVGGDFTLVDHDGQEARLSQYRGKAVLLHFGFTHCPDVCPTTLLEVARIKKDLGPLAERFQNLFVSVDPDRDTPARLKEYVQYFDPDIVGLTGSKAQLDEMTGNYKAFYELRREGSETDYNVDHSSYGYLIDTQGRVRSMHPYNDWAPLPGEIRQVLAEAPEPTAVSDPGKGSALFDPSVPRLSRAQHFSAWLVNEANPVPLNHLHDWTLHLETPSGEPVAGATIGIDGGMPEHSHGLPTEPKVTHELGDGKYLVEGVRFQMAGWWQLALNVSAGDDNDIVTFDLIVP